MNSERSLTYLLSDVVEQVSTLFHKEVQLVRAETSEKVRQARRAVISIGVGAIVLIPAMTVLLGAGVVWLEAAGMDLRWSILLVGGVATLVGLILVMMGLSSLSASNLVPQRSVEQLRRSAHTAQEQVQ